MQVATFDPLRRVTLAIGGGENVLRTGQVALLKNKVILVHPQWPLDGHLRCPYVDTLFALPFVPFVHMCACLCVCLSPLPSWTKWPLFFSFCHWTRHLQPLYWSVSKSLRLFSRLDYFNLSLSCSWSPLPPHSLLLKHARQSVLGPSEW